MPSRTVATLSLYHIKLHPSLGCERSFTRRVASLTPFLVDTPSQVVCLGCLLNLCLYHTSK